MACSEVRIPRKELSGQKASPTRMDIGFPLLGWFGSQPIRCNGFRGMLETIIAD